MESRSEEVAVEKDTGYRLEGQKDVKRREGGGGACHIFYFAETYEAGLIGRSPGFIYKFERSLSSPSRHCVARPRERYNSDEKVGILSLSLSLSLSSASRVGKRR